MPVQAVPIDRVVDTVLMTGDKIIARLALLPPMTVKPLWSGDQG
ncbi:MAG: hypothetical protein P8Y42_07525 [Exilibacterium sp.]